MRLRIRKGSSMFTPNSLPSIYSKKPDELVLLLRKSGWSQEQIAVATGVSQPTICRILSGQHKDPRYSVVEKLRQLVMELDGFSAV